MKRIIYMSLILFAILFQVTFSGSKLLAADIVAKEEYKNFNGEVVSNIEIYDNGTVKIDYRYGLRKVDMYYCVKGEQCDSNMYDSRKIMESSEEEPFKNDGASLQTYDFKIGLDEEKEYRIRIEAFFGTSSAYSGTESIYGSFTVGSVQIADTEENYISGARNNDIKDEGIRKLMGDVESVVNSVVLPIIYAITGMVLVVKGAILGVEIVKAADDPGIRREKIGALKWLLIGVGVAFLATTVVGVITGFFKDAFNL